MYKKALKFIAPYVVVDIIVLLLVALVSGVQAVINASIFVVVGNCISALYYKIKEDNDKDK